MFAVEKCVSELERNGYKFSLMEDGVVSVRQPATYNPFIAEMMNFLALHKEELRRLVRSQQPKQMTLSNEVYHLSGIPPDEAFPLAEAVKRGEALLVGKVIFHRSTGLFDITFIPLEARYECKA